VRIISHRAIREFVEQQKAAAKSLDDWYRIAKKARWRNLAEVRTVYPHADLVGKCTVFNIAGNKYRLIAKIAFHRQILYIKHIFTHKRYDQGGWKDGCRS